MSIKYVVFDWDGTLADTYPVISAAYDHTFKALQLPRIPYNEIRCITATMPNRDILDHIFGSRKEEAAVAYYGYIKQHHAENLQAMPNARRILDFCRTQDLKCFLLTNKQTQYVADEIKAIGFDGLFDKVCAAGEQAEDKPHPTATHAVFDNKLPPADQILIVGDGEADYKTARTYDRGGKKAVCIIYDSAGHYHGPTPDYCISDLSQAIQIIGDLNA